MYGKFSFDNCPYLWNVDRRCKGMCGDFSEKCLVVCNMTRSKMMNSGGMERAGASGGERVWGCSQVLLIRTLAIFLENVSVIMMDSTASYARNMRKWYLSVALFFRR